MSEPKLYHNKRIGPHVGTVAYFDERWEMCGPHEASHAKLNTADGSCYFFEVTPTTSIKKADRKPKPKKSKRAERFVWKPGDIRITKPGTSPRNEDDKHEGAEELQSGPTSPRKRERRP